MDITAAHDGLEAVNMIHALLASLEEPPKMIFMDNLMPNMNGPEATKQIRQLGYKGLIYGLTGQASREDKEEFLQAGADQYLPNHWTFLLSWTSSISPIHEVCIAACIKRRVE